MKFRSVIAASTVVLGLACGDSTGLEIQDLEGTWQATSIVFTNGADPTQTVDIVTVDGASYTLTVAASGTVSTVFDDGQGGTSSDSGTFNADGSNLTLAGEVFTANRSGNSLTLVDNSESYDFDGDGSDEAASLRIELSRQ